jgi:DNA-binding NarL/FixJ family response regulator
VEVEGSVTTVVVADDHPTVRAYVRETLETGGFSVVAEASDAQSAVEAVRAHRPHVVLLDINMPGGGIAAAQEISGRLPDVAIVMLTVSRADDDLFQALRAGATGYLLKDIDPVRLPAALQGVLRGEAALPRALVAKVIEEFRQRDDHRRSRALPQNARLSSREWEVADGLAQGLSTNEIADMLFIGDNTVRSHIASILRKLRVSSREEAVELLREEEER